MPGKCKVLILISGKNKNRICESKVNMRKKDLNLKKGTLFLNRKIQYRNDTDRF